MRKMMMAGMIVAATSAQAKSDLRDVESVWNGLLKIGIADEIRKKCDSIDARMLRAITRLTGIQNEAKSLGYTRDEIDAFRNSEENKAEMRAEGEAYLEDNGVVLDDAETYCALGRVEIENASEIGTLLRAN